MLYKEFEKNREDILENEFCMQSNASTLPITDCPSYTPICTIGICIQGNAKIRMDSQEYTIHPHDVFVRHRDKSSFHNKLFYTFKHIFL